MGLGRPGRPGAGGDPGPSPRVQGHRLGQAGEATGPTPTSWPRRMRADLVARAYVPDPETRALRQLLRYRAFLVDIRRAVKNRNHALLDRSCLRPPVATLFSRRGLKWLQSLPLSRPYGEELGASCGCLVSFRPSWWQWQGGCRSGPRATPGPCCWPPCRAWATPLPSWSLPRQGTSPPSPREGPSQAKSGCETPCWG